MSWLNESKRIKNKKFERAIVFIHGLDGSSLTWKGSSDRFVENLKTERNISDNFGLYIFEYHTKIVELGFFKKLLSIIPWMKKREFNVGIRRIAMELKTNLYELLRDYKVIVLVAHSMGGLITKRALVEMEEEEIKRIKLFVSMSVPHIGAGLADIGTKLFGENKQLIELKSFSDFTSDLTNRFSNLKNRPRVIYQAGSQDLVVPEGSAIPANVVSDDRIDTSDTHYTVLAVLDSKSHIPYVRLIRELNDILIWEQQQSLSNKANGEVSFNIPEHWSFKNVAEALVETANCTIEFSGFTNQELQIQIKSQELLKPNTFKALESLQFIGEHPVPKYQVKIFDSHFKIVKD